MTGIYSEKEALRMNMGGLLTEAETGFRDLEVGENCVDAAVKWRQTAQTRFE